MFFVGGGLALLAVGRPEPGLRPRGAAGRHPRPPLGREGRRPQRRHRAALQPRREHHRRGGQAHRPGRRQGQPAHPARAGPAPDPPRRVRALRGCPAASCWPPSSPRPPSSLLFGGLAAARQPVPRQRVPAPPDRAPHEEVRGAVPRRADAHRVVALGRPHVPAVDPDDVRGGRGPLSEEFARVVSETAARRPARRRARPHGRAARHPRRRLGGAGDPDPADRRRQARRPAPHAGRLHPGPRGDPT